MSDGQWRPELSVCAKNCPDSNLVIPSNTLWCGTYRINVTVSVGVNCKASSTDRSAPATTSWRSCLQVKVTARTLKVKSLVSRSQMLGVHREGHASRASVYRSTSRQEHSRLKLSVKVTDAWSYIKVTCLQVKATARTLKVTSLMSRSQMACHTSRSIVYRSRSRQGLIRLMLSLKVTDAGCLSWRSCIKDTCSQVKVTARTLKVKSLVSGSQMLGHT